MWNRLCRKRIGSSSVPPQRVEGRVAEVDKLRRAEQVKQVASFRTATVRESVPFLDDVIFSRLLIAFCTVRAGPQNEIPIARFRLRSRQNQETPNLLADRGEEFHFHPGMRMRFAVLHIDDAFRAAPAR